MNGKTKWLTALVFAAGGTLTAWAGPGIGPFGPWNTGGAYGGYGPYQPYVARGCRVQEGLRTAYVVRERAGVCATPVRVVRTRILTPAPVAETILEGPPVVAERVTIRRTRCAMPIRRVRVLTTERVVRTSCLRPVATRCIPRRGLAIVGERITTTPVVERVIVPSCDTVQRVGPAFPDADSDYANPYR